MNADFWNQRWHDNDIGFHESEVNLRLVKYLDYLQLAQDDRVFVPLCGKTMDIGWLLSNGYRVAGAEFSDLAVEHLFDALRIRPTVSRRGDVKIFSARGIDIFLGDVFDVSIDILGSVDAIYDRGALVALPYETRQRYTAHLTRISGYAPQLLITIDYDRSKTSGSPFPIN